MSRCQTMDPEFTEFEVFVGAFSAALLELYTRHRAMIRILEHHGIVQRETFEAEVESYLRDHVDQLQHEGDEWIKKFVAAYRKLHPPQS